MPEFNLAGFNPESVAFARAEGRDQLLVSSDDGNLKVGGKPQKKLKNPNLRRFRARLMPLPEAPGKDRP
jgi:hypothetical protein